MSTTTPTIVALMGRAGAGKDTAAEYLAQRHGFKAYALASPIKSMLTGLLHSSHTSVDHLHMPELKQHPMPNLGGRCARQLMTSLGDWGRSLDPQFWLNLAENHLRLQGGETWPRIVISDVRYPNEAGWVRKHGGRIWLIQRDDLPTVPAHASEYSHHQVVPDRTLENNLSREALYFALDQEVERLTAEQKARATEAGGAAA